MDAAFYIADRGTWFDRAIAGWDKGRYSHVELVLSRISDGRSLCFSSSSRDGGVRFKAIDLNDGKWDRLMLPLDTHQINLVNQFLAVVYSSRAKYDWCGIFGFLPRKIPVLRDLLGWWKGNDQRWFCSEVVTAALREAGMFPWVEPSEVSPNRLYDLLKHEGTKARRGDGAMEGAQR